MFASQPLSLFSVKNEKLHVGWDSDKALNIMYRAIYTVEDKTVAV